MAPKIATVVLLLVSGVCAERIGYPVVDTAGPGRGGPAPAAAGGRFLQRFDRNNDGKVTREEFDGPARRFGIVDKDGNGVVTREESEAAPLPPGRRGSDPRRTPGAAPARPPGERAQPSREPGKAPASPGKADHSDKPNFILILADDMGWTGLSVGMDDRIENSGSDFYQTPYIAGLAEQGMRFSQAYSPGAMCTPTRASILTGKTPAKVHITTPGRGGRPEVYQKLAGAHQLREFPASETTVAEALKEAGYATAHLGKWHLPTSDPGDHGFDVHDGSTANDGPGTFQDPNPKDIFGITERAVTFMENQVNAGRPFYLQLSHFAVHSPTLARAASIEKLGKLSVGERHSDVEYAAMTHDLDAGVGVLLDKIDAMGLAKNTYVVFMSDNGAPGGRRRPLENTPLRGGKGGFYEGGIRVPMIVRGPGIEAGSSCREAVIGYDLLPTFCAMAGVAAPDGVEGADLTSLLEGRSGQFERAMSLLFHNPHYGHGPQAPESAIILGDYKLIKKHDSGSLELFNLASDLSEESELSQKQPEMLAKMEKELTRRLEETKAQMPTPNPDYDPDQAPPRRPGQGKRKRGGR